MTTTSSALETPVHTGRPLSEEFDAGFEDRLTAYYCRDREFLIRAGDLVLPEQFSNKANGYWSALWPAISARTKARRRKSLSST